MSPEIVTALISGFVAIVVAAGSWYLTSRSYKLDKARFERELANSAEEAKRREVEMDKMKAEIDQIRQQMFREGIVEIRNNLNYFNRRAFTNIAPSGDPTGMYKALQDTRLSLQKSKAASMENKAFADMFSKAQRELFLIEQEVRSQFPAIEDATYAVKDYRLDSEARRQAVIKHMTSKESSGAERVLLQKISEFKPLIDKLENRLDELYDKDRS